ncbi:MAG TPA: amidohydrolase family protein [Anaerolineae bacterium]|jgi:carbamoyl-phosphate synthase/aspartate carbamoyltransferase/dihydroorotase|nr:amidohydrolase family protein [Anaerolineae bacterium]
MATVQLPGLIDIHVHLRDPGGTHKEDFSSGTAAALAGGFIGVVDMPNNTPPVVDKASLAEKLSVASRQARCDFALYMGATTDNSANPVTGPHVAGLKMYLDQTYGPLRVASLPVLMAHFSSWPEDKPIAVHAEGLSTATAIGLARVYDRHLHVCHVSRQAEIELIRQAKEMGARISCEVTPHHLFLTEDDARALGSLSLMKPTLATLEDQQALWRNLEVIDAVASDHAPHTLAEKRGDDPPPGVPGLETTLPLLLNAASAGRLTLERIVRLLRDGPAAVLNLRLPQETYVEVNTEAVWTIRGSELFTKCGWTPFEGLQVRGRVRKVSLRGSPVYHQGEGVLAAPGSGRPLVVG